MKKPKTDHLPAELMLLQYQLGKFRQAQAKANEELFQLEQRIHALRQPFLPQKQKP